MREALPISERVRHSADVLERRFAEGNWTPRERVIRAVQTMTRQLAWDGKIRIYDEERAIRDGLLETPSAAVDIFEGAEAASILYEFARRLELDA